MSSTPPEPVAPKTKLNLWDTTSLIVGVIIGVGIFYTPALVFRGVNGPWQGVGLWALGGFLSLLGALCYAELASTYPRSGGDYIYLTRAFGSPVGFLFAWVQITVIRTAGSTGVLAYAFGAFTSRFLGLKDNLIVMNCFFALGAIAVFTGVNIAGVYSGKLTQNFLTALKVLGLSGLLIAGFVFGPTTRAEVEPLVHHGVLSKIQEGKIILRQRDGTELMVEINQKTKVWLNGSTKNQKKEPFQINDVPVEQEIRVVAERQTPGLAESVKANTRPLFMVIPLGLILVFWSYAGWHEAAYVVAEVRDERRTVALALLIGTGAVMVIYLAINLACLSGLGFERAAESSEIAFSVFELPFGNAAGRAMALAVMLSCLGAINGTIFTSSRIFAEMGRDHPLFAPLAKWDPRWGTPVNALLVQGALSMVMVVFVSFAFGGDDPFDDLVNATAAAFWVFFLLTVISLFVLRKKDPDLPRPFRVPFYPIVPVIFCLACCWMIFSSVTEKPWHSLVGLGLLVMGIPLFWVSEAMKRGRR